MRPQLHYYHLAEGITAFSTTRHGGQSTGAFGELNINAYCGDTAEHIAANRVLLAHELQVDESCILLPHQVHGTECRLIDDDLMALSPEQRAAALEGVDCVLTTCRRLCIGVSTADCIPVLLYDPARHAAAALHAGWRGTMQRITEKAVDAMCHHFGTSPKDLLAVIGPGISLHNFEVGQEVYDAFASAGHDMEHIACRLDKWHIDLPLSNRMQLVHAGLLSEQITMSDICTYDAVDDYFSARRLGVDSGRIYTGIILR
ncbi:MAG: peptidoglycan editing factor PgeF [Prevotella sp.]|nr:peptidoglycan editing factor PgeF [Prevotella sp.]